jgi:curli biogenesis system outer membrane secretion channel CsgG
MMKVNQAWLGFALLALGTLAPTIGEAASTIAVMPFDYSQRVKARQRIERTGRNGSVWVVRGEDGLVVEFETEVFTNKLVTALVAENKFEVIERQKLDRLIDEQKLAEGGLVDPARCAELGKLLGAEYFIMTEISVYQTRAGFKYFEPLKRYKRTVTFDVIVDFRVVDTSTGKVVFADKAKVARRSEKLVKERRAGKVAATAVDEVQRELCAQIVRKVVDSVFPIKVVKFGADGVVYLNRGEAGGIKVGAIYKVVAQGEALVDEDTGLTLGAEESDVALISVTDVQAKFSKARVDRWLNGTQGSATSRIERGSVCRSFKGRLPASPPPPPADTTPPTVSLLSPKPGVTLNTNPVNIWVESPDADVVRVVINGAEAVAKGKGRYAIQIQAVEGENVIAVEAFDAAGNRGRASGAFAFDSTPPEVKASAYVVVRGRVDDPNSTVTLNGRSVELAADGSYEARLELGADRKVTIVATDEFGNSRTLVKQY